jgi:chromosome segregation ATPase
MAKKQFIRHLEFYGFPDQNKYTGFEDIDLSDIREKNKEQDEEIQDLEGEKADKKDLLELSGTVENLIAAQSEVNEAFAEAISGMSGDIEELKAIDDEFAEQLSAITDAVDDTINGLEELSGYTAFNLAELRQGFNAYTRYADAEFAHRNDVYTKAEIDERIPSGETFATQEWVKEQGYLTAESGDSMYAKIEDIDDISDIIESGFTQIEDELNDVDEKIDAVSAETTDKINEIDEKVDAFSGEVTSALSEINDAIDDANEKIDDITNDMADIAEAVSANSEAIDALEEAVQKNTDDISELEEKVSANTADIANIYDVLDTKANVSDLQDLHTEMECKFNELDEKKADKTDLDAVSGKVDSIEERLNQEIERSTTVDNLMRAKIDSLEEDVQEAVEKVDTFDDRINAVETGLTKEIADRIQGDLDLIGDESDSRDADTIWGAKNFAKEMRRQAISSAETYTDNAVAGFSTELAELEDEINQKLTAYATTGYVEDRISEEKGIITSDYNAKINAETERATRQETLISDDVAEVRTEVAEAKESIAHNATIIHAITEWEGSNPDDYDDSGNGILDVLHREFHEFEKTHGSIKSIEIKDGNLIITYMTVDGEKQEIVPITDILILDDYYKKEETDALLDEKLDVSAYTDISDRVSANTENIEAISGDVFNLDTALAVLIEKLGYKNNETLVTNGEHEVAFGEYNISHESEDPSGQTVFSVGIGTDDANRNNAVEIMKNGDLYLWVEGEFMNVNKLLGQIAHEIYDNDSTHNSHFFDGD